MTGALRARDERQSLHTPRRHRAHEGGKALVSACLHMPGLQAQHGLRCLHHEHRIDTRLGSSIASGWDGSAYTKAMLSKLYMRLSRSLNIQRARPTLRPGTALPVPHRRATSLPGFRISCAAQCHVTHAQHPWHFLRLPRGHLARERPLGFQRVWKGLH